MRQAFEEAHAQDMHELCSEITELKTELDEYRTKFAERLQTETALVVDEAVKSALAEQESTYAAKQKVTAGLVERLQKALAAALAANSK